MKKYTLYILMLLAAHAGYAQDTLKHFNPQSQTPTAIQYSGVHSGYYTGHNSLFDEEWAEKYYISGSNQVTGVIAYHTGSNGTYSEDCEYKVYSVGNDGLPDSELGKIAVSGSSLDISGKAIYTALSTPVSVSDSFFVSFNVGDYAHHSPGTKKIALMHGPDGSRDPADTIRYGRNAIRWHDHVIVWKDFYVDNGTKVKTHYAIFPVLTMENTSVSNFASSGSFKMFAAYPNPAINRINVKVNRATTSYIKCSIMDQKGSVVKQWQEQMHDSEQVLSADITSLPSGQYILIVKDGSGQLAQTFVKP